MDVFTIIPKDTRAIVFDFDGTIGITKNIWRKVNSEVIRQLRLDISFEELDSQIKYMTQQQISHIIKQQYKINQSEEEITEVFSKEAGSAYSECNFIYKADEFIIECHKQGIKMGIATTSPAYLIKAFFSTKDKIFRQIFNETNIVSCDDAAVQANKPNPRVYQVCLKRISETNDFHQVVIFEDYIESLKGAWTLHTSGAFVIAVVFKEQLEDAELMKQYKQHSDKIISDFSCWVM